MGKAILIEDDEDNLFLFKMALEGSFAEIDIFAYDNFDDAKKIFEKHGQDISLIVSDHNVGTQTSETFFDYVQTKNKEIPFIIVSAHTPRSNDYLQRVKTSELHCFWQKPVPVEEIEEYIKIIFPKEKKTQPF
jgi:DNA-binding NtrC family response regulator